ncbi:MAG TPA: SDR family NAD(P)-dependent oxidoreductase [Telluria sp.]|nr:SDR family NAD(P)-dependent oxidoreductase [Telluria sp.]
MSAILQPLLERSWQRLKVLRRLRVGPLALTYRFERPARVTANSRSRLRRQCGPAPDEGGLALLVGVGPGFGDSLARQLAEQGFTLALAARNAERLDQLAASVPGAAFAYGCDATLETSVDSLFELVTQRHGVPDLVVYAVQRFCPGDTLEVEGAAFEDCWRHNCLGSFLVARASARAMLARGSGTILLIGSTSSLTGRAGHLNLAVGRFGQRALAQVMARELWPHGLHVAHLVIDADIAEDGNESGGDPQADPAHIARIILDLHRQPPTAWSSEVDVRPFNERFWEHC